MHTWVRTVLYGLLTCAFVVAVLVVGQGFRQGWDQLSDTGYWINKAVVFAIVAVLYTAFAVVQRTRPEPPSSAWVSKGIRADPGAAPAPARDIGSGNS
jgi:hypothetical protein